MTAQPDGRRDTAKQRIGGWFFRTIFRPGWPQWTVLAVAALVFALAALALTGGADYREDPSALVPRSADVYVESRDLTAFLKTVSAWHVWKEDRRAAADEERNQLQVDIAGLLSDQVTGMSTSSPLRWIAAANRAAYAVSSAPAEEGGASWALYIHMINPAEALAEIEVERGMTLETIRGSRDAGGVFRLTGPGQGELYFGLVSPWLILSSQPKLPEFALESAKRPAFSLANADLVPGWKRGTSLRGLVNPAYRDGMTGGELKVYSVLTGWMAPDSRITYLSRVGSNGLETTFAAGALTDRVRGGGLWPLIAGLLIIVLLLSLAAAFAVLMVMVGWGGWIKTRAVRAGLMPAARPEPVEPSAAFSEDAGLAPTPPADTPAATPATDKTDMAQLSDPTSPVSGQNGATVVNLSGFTSTEAAETVDSPPSSHPETTETSLSAEANTAETVPQSEYGIMDATSGNAPVKESGSAPDTNESTDSQP